MKNKQAAKRNVEYTPLGSDNTADDIIEALEHDEPMRIHIVRAVNAHEELLDRLSLAVYHLEKWVIGEKTYDKYAWDVIREAKSIIAKAVALKEDRA